MVAGSPVVFLDRDDTLVVDSGYIDHPDKVQLVSRAAEAVRRIGRAGFRVVVVSNQSGVARGYFDEARLNEVNDRMRTLLSRGGAELDGIYCCPFLDGPEAKVEAYRCASDLRKPLPGMLLQAAKDLNLDLSRSWMIGDSARDIEAGRSAGCRTILIRNGRADGAESAATLPDFSTRSIIEAAMIVERESDDDVVVRDEPLGGEGAGRAGDAEQTKLLAEIRDLLDRQQREAMHDDFSIRRLVGTLVQMLALVVAAWGVYAMFSGQPGHALTRFSLAVFLQLVTISMNSGDRSG